MVIDFPGKNKKRMSALLILIQCITGSFERKEIKYIDWKKGIKLSLFANAFIVSAENP